jgi:hypothetical protein
MPEQICCDQFRVTAMNVDRRTSLASCPAPASSGTTRRSPSINAPPWRRQWAAGAGAGAFLAPARRRWTLPFVDRRSLAPNALHPHSSLIVTRETATPEQDRPLDKAAPPKLEATRVDHFGTADGRP